MKIAFIGLGNMGIGMANNLVKSNQVVNVYDINKNILESIKNKGFIIHNSIESAVKDVNVVITMLPEGQHVREVYISHDGIINNVKNNTILIDCSTIDIETSIKIGKKAKDEKIKMIDAPVSGGVMGAKNATLNIMVGGSKEDFELALPILKIMGKNIFHAGEMGCGNGAKICNNMSLGITMIAASESLMLAKRLNIDVKKVHEIMKSASGNSWPISVYPPVPGLIEGTPSNNNYKPGFSTAMMTKDLKLANQISKSVKANTPLGEKALKIYTEFCENGYSETDFSAISKLIGEDIWDYKLDIKKK